MTTGKIQRIDVIDVAGQAPPDAADVMFAAVRTSEGTGWYGPVTPQVGHRVKELCPMGPARAGGRVPGRLPPRSRPGHCTGSRLRIVPDPRAHGPAGHGRRHRGGTGRLGVHQVGTARAAGRHRQADGQRGHPRHDSRRPAGRRRCRTDLDAGVVRGLRTPRRPGSAVLGGGPVSRHRRAARRGSARRHRRVPCHRR